MAYAGQSAVLNSTPTAPYNFNNDPFAFGGEHAVTNAPAPAMPKPQAPQFGVGGPQGNSGAYDQSVVSGGYNPYQYATDATTNQLAQMFGGSVAKTQGAGPNAPPPQNTIDFGGGYVGNAGLTQQFIDTYGMDQAKRMFADMAKTASSGTDSIYTQPSFNTYNPSARPTDSSANIANPSFGSPSAGAQTGAQMLAAHTPGVAQSGFNPQQGTGPLNPSNGQTPPQQQPQAQGQGQDGQLLMQYLLPMLLSGMLGGQPQQPQQQNSLSGGGLNSLSGVAQLLSMITGMQQTEQPQSFGMPSTNLYYPMFG